VHALQVQAGSLMGADDRLSLARVGADGPNTHIHGFGTRTEAAYVIAHQQGP